jgi:hypothetical protein
MYRNAPKKEIDNEHVSLGCNYIVASTGHRTRDCIRQLILQFCTQRTIKRQRMGISFGLKYRLGAPIEE